MNENLKTEWKPSKFTGEIHDEYKCFHCGSDMGKVEYSEDYREWWRCTNPDCELFKTMYATHDAWFNYLRWCGWKLEKEVKALQSQIAARDALIERLVGAGQTLADLLPYSGENENPVNEFDAICDEWQAMKGGEG